MIKVLHCFSGLHNSALIRIWILPHLFGVSFQTALSCKPTAMRDIYCLIKKRKEKVRIKLYRYKRVLPTITLSFDMQHVKKKKKNTASCHSKENDLWRMCVSVCACVNRWIKLQRSLLGYHKRITSDTQTNKHKPHLNSTSWRSLKAHFFGACARVCVCCTVCVCRKEQGHVYYVQFD